MATTYTDNGGGAPNGSDKIFTFTFPVLQNEDVKVALNGVTQATTKYTVDTSTNPTQIEFNNTSIDSSVQKTTGAPKSGVTVRVFRETTVGKANGDDDPKAVFAAGSSIRASDLNANTEQALYAIHELQNQPIKTGDVEDGAITSGKIKDGAIATADLANNSVTTDKIADGAVTSNKFGNNSVSTAKITDANVTTAKLADDAVTAAKIADGNVGATQLASNAVTTVKVQDNAVTTAKIANDAVTTDKLANSIVSDITTNNAKVSNVTHTGEVTGSSALTITNNAVVEAKIANNAVTSNKIASNAVTTDKIADGELTTLAGMQSGTASVLADSTALTASTAELNQLDGITLETSVTGNSDTRIPTSKAVNDLVLSVTNALGGFVAIANETSFPTANPDPSNGAGTVVSISQVSSGSAITINNSGVATISNGAGTGNTVTITGFPTTLRNTSLAASSGLQVQTTTTLHTYTFHKQLASAADIAAISATVNSFSNRYRVSSSAPTSSLDGGDLWYDTTNSKLMVYSSQNSAWEEATAIGNFFISTITSSSSTGGGSATPNGTAYRFTISDAPTSAAQLIVSVDGVIQKPNAGSSQPSEGYVLVGNDIILGSAPANGASLFVTVIGSTVGIGTPSNNTVTSAILQNGSVTTAKIVDANVTNAKLANGSVQTSTISDSAVSTGKIADDAVTNAKIANGAVQTSQLADDAVTAGKLANSINSEIAANTAKVTNATHTGDVTGATSLTIASGAVTTAKIADDAVTAAKLANTSVTAGSYGTASAIPAITVDAQGRITAASTNAVSIPPAVGGSNGVDFNDNVKARFGTGNDLEIYHTGGYNLFHATNGYLQTRASAHYLNNANNSNNFIRCENSSSNDLVSLHFNGTKRFETTSYGALVSNQLAIQDGGTKLSKQSGGSLRIATDNGYVDVGPQNSGFCHFSTDRGQYYFNAAVQWDGHILPYSNNAYDLGGSSNRWRNVYTNDLNLSNEGSSNDVDGTWGDWTIQEGESDLFLKNNRSGKKYKFNLTEVS